MTDKSMQQYLPEQDENKLQKILSIKEDYNAGRISLEEGRKRLKEEVGKVTPYEIAMTEQHLKEIENDECRKEDIQQMLDLFSEVMCTERPQLPEEHPINCYYRENDLMRQTLLAVEDLVQYPMIKNQWYELYDRLQAYKLHFSRKQNQLYSLLEQKGFDRPSTTMWLLDDFIRDEIRDARRLLDEGKEDEFIAMQATIVADVRDLMTKEETVLYPTSLAMISPEEFEHMKQGDREIGFAGFSLEPVADHATKQTITDTSLAAELSELLARHGLMADKDSKLDVATGKLTLDQINLIYQHMPVDLSYVDENELVCFYSDTKHRVFPRSRNVIGREVMNCHPRTSAHVVREIIDKFRSGEQDSAEFWINKPNLFIYIYYVAVRDAKGRFRGVLEMMQDCTHIRSLEGSQTLLNWGDGSKQIVEEPKREPADAQEGYPDNGETLLTLTPETKLKALLIAYPWLKEQLPTLNAKFNLLKTPLARVMTPIVTLSTMAERSGMPIAELIRGIEQLIEQHKRQ